MTQTKDKPKVYIERVEPLTIEGIRAICLPDKEYEEYCKKKIKKR